MDTDLAEERVEIQLYVDGQVFKADKSHLCQHSDYFRAMFSGNYVEQGMSSITIDVIDAESMAILIRYMNIGLIDLTELSLETLENLAMAANFLQVTELTKQIKYGLDTDLSLSNWVSTMAIAEKASYPKVEQLAAAFGLFSFRDMRPGYIPNLQKLVWYLSHPYLALDMEYEVFEFGHSWLLRHETCTADNFLIILRCLDVTKVTAKDIETICSLMVDCDNSLAMKVLKCFKMFNDEDTKISISEIVAKKRHIIEKFSESVYTEVHNIVRDSKQRKLQYTAVVPAWTNKDGKLDQHAPLHMYKFTVGNGLDKWIELTDKQIWGWNLTTWGIYRLVQVCGEHGRGTGRFMKDVKVYDTLRQEWVQHGVQLPSRRHAGVTVCGDLMYIVGGVGSYRVLEDSTTIYNLKKRTHTKGAKFPEAIQSPAICTHEGSIYATGQKRVYKYVERDDHDTWTTVMRMDIRANKMVSYKDYIYCSQNYFAHFYRFRPEFDEVLEVISQFTAPPVALCRLNDWLIAFTWWTGQVEKLRVEICTDPFFNDGGSNSDVMWCDVQSTITINDVAGAGSIVLNMPVIENIPSNYQQKYITQYMETHSD